MSSGCETVVDKDDVEDIVESAVTKSESPFVIVRVSCVMSVAEMVLSVQMLPTAEVSSPSIVSQFQMVESSATDVLISESSEPVASSASATLLNAKDATIMSMIDNATRRLLPLYFARPVALCCMLVPFPRFGIPRLEAETECAHSNATIKSHAL